MKPPRRPRRKAIAGVPWKWFARTLADETGGVKTDQVLLQRLPEIYNPSDMNGVRRNARADLCLAALAALLILLMLAILEDPHLKGKLSHGEQLVICSLVALILLVISSVFLSRSLGWFLLAKLDETNPIPKEELPVEYQQNEPWRARTTFLFITQLQEELLSEEEYVIALMRLCIRFIDHTTEPDHSKAWSPWEVVGLQGLPWVRSSLQRRRRRAIPRIEVLRAKLERVWAGDVRQEILDLEGRIKKRKVDERTADAQSRPGIEKELVDLDRELQDLKDWQHHVQTRKPVIDPVQEKFEKEYVPELTRQEQARVRAKKSRVEAEFEKLRHKNELLKRADNEPDLTPADRERLKALIRKEYEEDGGLGIYRE